MGSKWGTYHLQVARTGLALDVVGSCAYIVDDRAFKPGDHEVGPFFVHLQRASKTGSGSWAAMQGNAMLTNEMLTTNDDDNDDDD
jgi:hypothetical protein